MEESLDIKIWDCGSPLYDAYELVAVSNLMERHFMILPYLSGSRKSNNPSSRFVSPPLKSAAASSTDDHDSVFESPRHGRKFCVIKFLNRLMEKKDGWRKKSEHNLTKKKTGIVGFSRAG